ncbi:NAD-dependent epimerase/dehydratase family protein [Mucilaginibacter panaciglaebae]|uniref:NAD-dependent epimerase n=1 Tax=Mucilaginibacter panaciglaebae TaxID=502331 RepID=A0ABP7WE79_9SPHI
MKILVTGCAGFIGFHLARHLLNRGDEVIGLDNLNDYYDVNLKYSRLSELGISSDHITGNKCIVSDKFDNFQFYRLDVTDVYNVGDVFKMQKFDVVCHLAAQAGVRYSLKNPFVYIDSNVKGFLAILECCTQYKVKHLVYASSSSVYGLNYQMPFATNQRTDKPASLYAATKKCNELMAHSYSHLHGLRTTGLRFFTVYGPWGRPDMALFEFTKSIIEGRPINVFNNGNMKRDFTYIDDIINGIIKIIDPKKANEADAEEYLKPDILEPLAVIYNIGKGQPVKLLDFIAEIEKCLNIKAIKKFMPLQSGDVLETWADINELKNAVGYEPLYTINEGVKKFVSWYLSYHALSPAQLNIL